MSPADPIGGPLNIEADLIHGFAYLPWDDYRIPAHIWRSLTQDGGCWRYKGAKDVNPQMIMVTRLTGLTRNDVLAAVPTCGTVNCANPAHICVTRKQ